MRVAMPLTALSGLLLQKSFTAQWPEQQEGAFKALFGSPEGRYPATAEKSVTLRAPQFKAESGVPFAAYIHPSNPSSGAYGGMSIAIFPVADAPCLLSFVVGTQGLSPDEEILGRPGHARKVQAICAWLNRKHGHGKLVAWAKDDPVRTDQDLPGNLAKQFPAYRSVFDRYGRVLYAIFAPTDDKTATRDAITAFLDLMFEERGYRPLSALLADAERIRSEWFQHLMPDVTSEGVRDLLRQRRFAILQGPPGTGKTRMALELLKHTYRGQGFTIQFHPNTTYENVIGGLAPLQTSESLGLRFAPLPGALMQAAQSARANPDQPFLLHIDEINRADLAKVLGEAIFLLEAGDAEPRTLQLPYDFGPPLGRHFELPGNLHILGTMNSADRSIAIVDVAVRRRFAFVKVWPQLRVIEEFGCPFMERAFIDLTSIFVEHATRDAFDLVPGHSYYLESDESAARRRLKVTLGPLLEEYLAQGYVAGFSEPIRSYLQWIESL
jgi:5-methylcytosine-specific restriction protein B